MPIDAAQGGTTPATHAFSVTPDDNTDLGYMTRGLYVGGAGDIAVVTSGGDAVTFGGVVAGTILPIRVARVKSTGTTATGLVGLY